MANKKTALKRAKKEAARLAKNLGLTPAAPPPADLPTLPPAVEADPSEPTWDSRVKKAG